MIDEDSFLAGYWVGAFAASFLVSILSIFIPTITFVLMSIGCFIIAVVYIQKIKSKGTKK